MRLDGKAYGFRDRECPVCKKTFIPAAYHDYDDNGVLYCSYTCYMKRRSNKRCVGHPPKPVHQFTLSGVYVATYESAEKAAETVGIMHVGNIRNCCTGLTKSSGGYTWSYEKEKTSSDAVESLG